MGNLVVGLEKLEKALTAIARKMPLAVFLKACHQALINGWPAPGGDFRRETGPARRKMKKTGER